MASNSNCLRNQSRDQFLLEHKTKECINKENNHDKKCCDFFHKDIDDKRRAIENLNNPKYKAKACNKVYDFVNKKWKKSTLCSYGDKCEFAHTSNEINFHPNNYEQNNCKIERCNLGKYCYFKHSESNPKKFSSNKIITSQPIPKQDKKNEGTFRSFSDLFQQKSVLKTDPTLNSSKEPNKNFVQTGQLDNNQSSLLITSIDNDDEKTEKISLEKNYQSHLTSNSNLKNVVAGENESKNNGHKLYEMLNYCNQILKADLNEIENIASFYNDIERFLPKLDSIYHKDFDTILNLKRDGKTTVEAHKECIERFDLPLTLIIFEHILKKDKTIINRIRNIRNEWAAHYSDIGISKNNGILDKQKLESYCNDIKNSLHQILPVSYKEIINDKINDINNMIIIENRQKYDNQVKEEVFKDLDKVYNKHLNQNEQGDQYDDANANKLSVKTIAEIYDSVNNKKYIFILILFGLEANEKLNLMLKKLNENSVFNLILDFNHDSIKKKIYDSLKPNKRIFQTNNLNNLYEASTAGLTNSSNDELLDNKCFYIKCNGCSFNQVEKPEEINNQLDNVKMFLINFILHFSSTLNIFSLNIIGQNGLSEIIDPNFKLNDIYSKLNEVTESFIVKKKINTTVRTKHVLYSCLTKSELNKYFNRDTIPNNFESYFDLSYEIIINTLSKFGNDPNSQNDSSQTLYFIPSNNEEGRLPISRERVSILKQYMKIYHFDYGKLDSVDENTVRNYKKKFHKGESLSPEMLWIQENLHITQILNTIYIEREQVDDIITEFKKNKSIWDKGIFRIEHRRSAGATTMSRHILYKIRKHFICFEITNFDRKKLIEQIKSIKDDYKKEIIILLAEEVLNKIQLTENVVQEFQQELKNVIAKNIKIIYVCKNDTIVKTQYLSDKSCYYLSTTLYDKERLLMKSILNDVLTIYPKIHFYVLYCFAEEFDNIKKLVEESIENLKCIENCSISRKCLNCRENLVLIMLSFIQKYSKSEYLCKEAVSFILNIGMDHLEHIFVFNNEDTNRVKYLTELILYDVDTKQLKIAHDVISNKVLNIIESQKIDEFTNILITLAKNIRDIPQYKNLLTDILIKNKALKSEDRNEKEPLTKFINYLKYSKKTDYALDFIKKVAEFYKDDIFFAHLSALYARVKFYEEPRDSNTEKEAIKLLEDDYLKEMIEKDPDLLCIYGNLIRNHLKKEFFDKNFRENKTEYNEYFEKAKLAYEKARELPKKYNKSQTFGAMRLYCDYLKISHKCYNQKKKNKIFIDDYEKYENEILTLNDTFEDLSNRGKIYGYTENLDNGKRLQSIKKGMARIMIDLIKLKSSNSIFFNQNPIEQNINEINRENFVKTILETVKKKEYSIFLMLKYLGIKSLQNWNDLNKSELMLIIGHIEALEQKKLISSYNDFINAIIHLNQIEYVGTYNIHFALKYSEEWIKSFNNDFNAHYFNGVINFVLSLQEQKKVYDYRKKAIESFKKCKELCFESQENTIKNYKFKEFYVGKGKGIEAIVPYKNRNKKRLNDFVGRIKQYSTNSTYFIMDCSDLSLSDLNYEIKVGEGEKVKIEISDQSECLFNLAFSRDIILAENIRRKEYNRPDSETEYD